MSDFISVFDIFKIGVGPSSSHTVGPMKCAYDFATDFAADIARAARITVALYGSLSLTGKGHSTDKAVILGLSGHHPQTLSATEGDSVFEAVSKSGIITIQGKPFDFAEGSELLFMGKQFLDFHSNGLIFYLFDAEGTCIRKMDYYSTGGGFIIRGDQITASRDAGSPTVPETKVTYPFDTAGELVTLCEQNAITIDGVMRANELLFRSEAELNRGLQEIWEVMNDCIERGFATEGILPGGLGVKRRAAMIHKRLQERELTGRRLPAGVKDWISVYALAVNEENAAGGKVVTAPTNGAAGIIPAVFRYYLDFYENTDPADCIKYLLTAGAIGNLYKKNASFSAAEVGCQGEVGVACSMAAAGLTALSGGSCRQVEHAAEIGMEHNLGLTCDPVGGLVQIPCIERNTVGANTAVTAVGLALMEDGEHKISLDTVIKTMFTTGKDMANSYKETSLAGLAVNSIEC